MENVLLLERSLRKEGMSQIIKIISSPSDSIIDIVTVFESTHGIETFEAGFPKWFKL